MKIGAVDLSTPFAIAPMAGMTDTAFRRLVKRHGGCGLVVTEMVSSEGLVRGMEAISLGHPVEVPVGPETLGRVLNVIGQPAIVRSPTSCTPFWLASSNLHAVT